jgi:hypothetical protein
MTLDFTLRATGPTDLGQNRDNDLIRRAKTFERFVCDESTEREAVVFTDQ